MGFITEGPACEMFQISVSLNMKAEKEVQYTNITQYDKVALYLAFPLFPYCTPHLLL